jgi:histidinol-phosphatase (PHP family)
MHSNNSPDSHATLDDLCESAIRRGLAGVCFTEHVDFDPSDSAYGYINYEEYLSDIDGCRGKYGDRLDIRAGVEVTYQTEFADDIRRFLDTHRFDYVLGSVHLIDHIFIGSPAYFMGKSESEACEPYWRETMAMLRSGLFTRIGHLDYIRTRWPREYGRPGLGRWRRPMTDILQLAIESGAIIEVNTSAIRRQLGGPYPDWETLELYRELGGARVIMGSDAHNALSVGQYFPEVAARLEKMGLTVCSECEALC